MQRCRDVQRCAEWCREEMQRRCSIGVEMWRCRVQRCRVQGAEQVQMQWCKGAEMQRCSIDVEM